MNNLIKLALGIATTSAELGRAGPMTQLDEQIESWVDTFTEEVMSE